MDSGATSHYFKPTHQHALSNVKTLTFGPSATLPDNSIVTATKSGTFNLHQAIDKSARTALIMPNLKNESLVSVGKLCDNDCKVVFTKHNVKIIKNAKVLSTGNRNTVYGL